MSLWDRDTELNFFIHALNNFASPEQLFFNDFKRKFG